MCSMSIRNIYTRFSPKYIFLRFVIAQVFLWVVVFPFSRLVFPTDSAKRITVTTCALLVFLAVSQLGRWWFREHINKP